MDDDHRRTNEGKTVILFGLLLTTSCSTAARIDGGTATPRVRHQVFIEMYLRGGLPDALRDLPFRVGLLTRPGSLADLLGAPVFWSLIVGIYRIFLGRQVSKYLGGFGGCEHVRRPAGEQRTYCRILINYGGYPPSTSGGRALAKAYAQGSGGCAFHRTGGSRPARAADAAPRVEDDVGPSGRGDGANRRARTGSPAGAAAPLQATGVAIRRRARPRLSRRLPCNRTAGKPWFASVLHAMHYWRPKRKNAVPVCL